MLLELETVELSEAFTELQQEAMYASVVSAYINEHMNDTGMEHLAQLFTMTSEVLFKETKDVMGDATNRNLLKRRKKVTY